MLQFLLPRLSQNLYLYLATDPPSDNSSSTTTTATTTATSSSLSFFLHHLKNTIQEYEFQWDECKKRTNPYEYIHTMIPTTKLSVAKCRPLSRSYFKMIEIIHFFDLPAVFAQTIPIRSFHLAEGPGGFIQALVEIRKNSQDIYYGMTLIQPHDAHEDVPGWKKSRTFLREHRNVVVESGADGTGDILSWDNFQHVCAKYRHSMHVITADGGFDFSRDFGHQEVNASILIFAQITYALCLQKEGGWFVLKMFDMFTKFTTDMMAILASVYEEVYVTKPYTSRMANSEKYLVCKHFLPVGQQCASAMASLFSHIHANNTPWRTREGILPLSKVPRLFFNKVEELNAVFGQRQIENIHSTLLLCAEERGKIRPPPPGLPSKGYPLMKCLGGSGTMTGGQGSLVVPGHIEKCIQWCQHYGVPYDSTVLKYARTTGWDSGRGPKMANVLDEDDRDG